HDGRTALTGTAHPVVHARTVQRPDRISAWTGLSPFLNLRRFRGPMSCVTRAGESELPDRHDRFDRPGLGQPPRLTDACQRRRDPLVTEALPVGFAVPPGHDAPAA